MKTTDTQLVKKEWHQFAIIGVCTLILVGIAWQMKQHYGNKADKAAKEAEVNPLDLAIQRANIESANRHKERMNDPGPDGEYYRSRQLWWSNRTATENAAKDRKVYEDNNERSLREEQRRSEAARNR